MIERSNDYFSVDAVGCLNLVTFIYVYDRNFFLYYFGRTVDRNFNNVVCNCVIGEKGDLRCEATEVMSGPG